MAFDHRPMHVTCLLGLVAIAFGVVIPVYLKLSEKLAARGIELSTFGHITLVAATLLIGLLFCFALVAVWWIAVGAGWVLQRAYHRIRGERRT